MRRRIRLSLSALGSTRSRVIALLCVALIDPRPGARSSNGDGTAAPRARHALLAPDVQQPSEPPSDWIDAATGHRVIRLSRDPGTASLYFHQNGYTASGDKLVVTTRQGLAAIDLQTRRIDPIIDGRTSHVVVGRKSRVVFYIKGGTVYETHIDTHATRSIVSAPELSSGSGLTVNADDTLLAGSYVEGVDAAARDAAGARGAPPRVDLEARWAARLPMSLYTIDIKSGAVTRFHHSTDWLNHVQFSPTDPALLMFCHEGPWHKVDRIWTIRTDGTGLRKIHSRTMEMEIAGHEFFSHDGRTIWYDLQTPKSRVFWLAGVVLASGQAIRYKLAQEEWSVHFNQSLDGALFAGDGGGPRSVAAPRNGQWIYLFTPADGALHAEKLVNLAKHDYRLEPNVTFTPDGKWIVFRSNMHGPTHVYAVEVARTASPASDAATGAVPQAVPAPAGAIPVAELAREFRSPPDDSRIKMRWWWFGSAVTKPELERELRPMKDGGIGGVEVQPVHPLSLDDPAAPSFHRYDCRSMRVPWAAAAAAARRPVPRPSISVMSQRRCPSTLRGA